MNLAFQDIPDVLDASNSFIIDQGVAVFAMVIFSIVIFGMMGLMFMMQRQTGKMLKQMGQESNQQDKLITQNDLNRVAAQRNSEDVIDIKTLLGKLIEVQEQGLAQKNETIETGIASIDKLDGSVNTMQITVDNLEKAIREMIAKMQASEGRTLEISEQSKLEIVKAVTDSFEPIVKQCLQDAIRSTQETPTVLHPIPKPDKPDLIVPDTRDDKEESKS